MDDFSLKEEKVIFALDEDAVETKNFNETCSHIILNTCIVNESLDGEFKCYGFKRSMCRSLLYYLFGFLSCGFCFLLGYWNPVYLLRCTHQSCILTDATAVLIKYKDNRMFVSHVEVMQFIGSSADQSPLKHAVDYEKTIFSKPTLRFFRHMFVVYYWCPVAVTFVELYDFEEKLTCRSVYEHCGGVQTSLRSLKTMLYGKNIINVPLRTYPVLFFQLAADPFYIFQLFACIVWTTDDYIYYAIAIFVMTLMSLLINTYQTHKYMKKLHEMVARFNEVLVMHSPGSNCSDFVKMSSSELVPGDVFVIPNEGIEILCDAVVLSGRVVVNESSLTGESYPVTKTALDNNEACSERSENCMELYSTRKHRLHTVYNGTTVLQARPSSKENAVLAMVICTGFNTAKGRLIRSILHPKPVHFSFFRDSLKFILVLGFLAFIGFIYTLVNFIKKKESVLFTLRRSLDIITIAVPPALPFAMTIGIVYALHRLTLHEVFCIDPARINVCGKLKMFVFDKTGTLTEDHLSISTVIPAQNGLFKESAFAADDIVDTAILKAMAACHNLASVGGKLIGNHLDQYMFEFTKWSLQEPDVQSTTSCGALHVVVPPAAQSKSEDGLLLGSVRISIFRQFQFESVLQRMTVIAQEYASDTWVVYSKGSPERIMKSCRAESVPDDALTILQRYTSAGHRVLAIAGKDIAAGANISQLSRGEVEADLEFLGFIVFNNVLKAESAIAINALHDANIRCIMATGDNLQTAVTIAGECGMLHRHQNVIEVSVREGALTYALLQTRSESVPQNRHKGLEFARPLFFCDFTTLPYGLALTGETYLAIKNAFPDLVPRILMSAAVYARMSPTHKSALVEDLKQLGYIVGMCGDGANDCGALNAAHAGIALSESEASIASPFTSKIFNISCVPRLIREGRCALVTSFSTFKYMALYSMVQYLGVLILNTFNSNYSYFQFLYADCALVLPLISTMVQSSASECLAVRRPPGRLVHPLFIIGLVLQIVIQLVFQVVGLLYSQSLPFYRAPDTFLANKKYPMFFECYENYAVITVAMFQYLWLASMLSKGRPYRQPTIFNARFAATFLVGLSATFFIAFHPVESIRDFLGFASVPSRRFVWLVLAIAAASGFTSFIVEKWLIPSAAMHAIVNKIRRKRLPRNKYKIVFAELLADSHWPPFR